MSQFTKEAEQHTTLADFISIEKDVYPIGRLDRDSEGILLLSNDNALKTRLLSPNFQKPKTYLVQVENEITHQAIERLKSGLHISVKGKKYLTKRGDFEIINEPILSPRNPPIRYRKNIGTSWVKATIFEGKNRQVRKMMAAVGFPCLRLIRISFSNLEFPDLAPGEIRPLTSEEVAKLKSI